MPSTIGHRAQQRPVYDTVGATFFPCSLAIFHFAAGHATRSMRTHLVDGRENRPGLLAWFHTGVHQGRGKAHLNDTYAQRQGTRGASQGHRNIRVPHRSRRGRHGASQGHQNTRVPRRQDSSNACTWARTKPERMQQAPRECLCSPTGCQGSVQGAHLARDPRPAPTRLAALAHRSLLFRSRTPYAAVPWMVCYDAVSKALKDLVQDSKHSRDDVITHL